MKAPKEYRYEYSWHWPLLLRAHYLISVDKDFHMRLKHLKTLCEWFLLRVIVFFRRPLHHLLNLRVSCIPHTHLENSTDFSGSTVGKLDAREQRLSRLDIHGSLQNAVSCFCTQMKPAFRCSGRKYKKIVHDHTYEHYCSITAMMIKYSLYFRFHISRKKFKSGLGFEPWTCRSLAWWSSIWTILVQLIAHVQISLLKVMLFKVFWCDTLSAINWLAIEIFIIIKKWRLS